MHERPTADLLCAEVLGPVYSEGSPEEGRSPAGRSQVRLPGGGDNVSQESALDYVRMTRGRDWECSVDMSEGGSGPVPLRVGCLGVVAVSTGRISGGTALAICAAVQAPGLP